MASGSRSQLNSLKDLWVQHQLELKNKLLLEDTEGWQEQRNLNLVAGMDLSVSKSDMTVGCCTLVVCSISQHLNVIYEDSLFVKITTPYIPGFLAFREIEPCLTLYNKLTSSNPELIPDVIMFDGNGILHPRGLGLASHFGAVQNVCTVGVAKNLYQMNNIVRDDIHTSKIHSLEEPGDHILIENTEGHILGAALKTTREAVRPVYVSVGNRINLKSAIWTVMKCVDKFRIPEPTRQADIRSRQVLRNSEANTV